MKYECRDEKKSCIFYLAVQLMDQSVCRPVKSPEMSLMLFYTFYRVRTGA